MKNQPAAGLKDLNQTPLSHSAVSFFLSSLSLSTHPLSSPSCPPSSCQFLLLARGLFLWSPACDTRLWAHLAVSVPRGPCTVKLSRAHPAFYLPSTRRHSTMLILKEVHSLCNAAFNYLSSAELPLTCRELIRFHRVRQWWSVCLPP